MHTINPIQENHYADYVELIGSQLGEGYFTTNDFAQLKENPNALCFEAVDANNTVLGVITSMVLPYSDAIELLKISPENLPDYAKTATEIGIFKTIAISKNAQGQGIGSSLTKYLLEQLKQRVNTVACVAWKYGETENIKGVMNTFEFKCYQEIPDYWVEDTDFICPACGTPPCHCQANIYFKRI